MTCVFGERMMVFAPQRWQLMLHQGWPPAGHIMAPASLLGGREALVTQAFRQVNRLRLNSWGLDSGLPSIVRKELLISCYR